MHITSAMLAERLRWQTQNSALEELGNNTDGIETTHKRPTMYVIIGDWQIGDINLRRVMSFDGGGFLFNFELVEGRDTRQSLQLDKLERLRGTIQRLEWQDYDGAVSRGTGVLEGIKAITREGPDAKQITLYSCTVNPAE